MPEFKGKTVLVTGASRGIGRALVEAFLAEGARVVAVARSTPVDGDRQKSHRNVTWIACDIASGVQRAALADSIRALGRPLDILVNNAGIQQSLDLTGDDPGALCDAMETEIAVNLVAPICLTAQLMPVMARPGGTIVNVTSLVALQAKTSAPAYSASKAGFQRFTEALRRQVQPHGLRVVEVMPPLVDTAMTTGRGRRKLTPEDMAAALLQGLADHRERIAPGIGRMALALNRIAPALLARIIGRQ
ncbi:SDR family NAD(P)-dependent oxidoreductase [Oricola indica]|uniref:SDR family NAD(P)-dependent oxidoreductase n=1 Tax=Oricola indica TaxID=2872591 RepID=UPI003CCBABDA